MKIAELSKYGINKQGYICFIEIPNVNLPNITQIGDDIIFQTK